MPDESSFVNSETNIVDFKTRQAKRKPPSPFFNVSADTF